MRSDAAAAEAGVVHSHGAAAADLESYKEKGDGGRQEDENSGWERNGHKEVSQLAMEATHSSAAHNGVRIVVDVLGGDGDAEEQSCKAAAASVPW